MSSMVSEFGFAIPLKGAKYDEKTAHFIRSKINIELDEDEDYFCSRDKSWVFHAVDGGLWICKRDFYERDSGDMNESLNIAEINKRAREFSELFDVDVEKIEVFAMVWYNGSDNPFVYKKIK